MTRYFAQRTLAGFALFVATLAGSTSQSQAAPTEFKCTAEKNTVKHLLFATIDDGKVTEFDYGASTPVEGSMNSCTVDNNNAKPTDVAPGVQSFKTDAGEILVTKKGRKFVFDFSKVTMSDVCGQSSTIAAHITITPGSKHCTDVSNRD